MKRHRDERYRHTCAQYARTVRWIIKHSRHGFSLPAWRYVDEIKRAADHVESVTAWTTDHDRYHECVATAAQLRHIADRLGDRLAQIPTHPVCG